MNTKVPKFVTWKFMLVETENKLKFIHLGCKISWNLVVNKLTY